MSTPYPSSPGNKTLHVASGVADGKYNLLLSICVNLHPLWYITRVFILTWQPCAQVSRQPCKPYVYICIFNRICYQIDFLKWRIGDTSQQWNPAGSPPLWWAFNNKLHKLLCFSLQWFHRAKWAENRCTNMGFLRNGKSWIYVSHPLQ